MSGIPVQHRQIEKSSDAVHVEQMRLVRAPREAHSNERSSGQELISLPCLQRKRDQHFVLANHEIRLEQARSDERVLEPDNWLSLYAEIRKKSGEVVGQIWVSSDTKCSQTRGVFSHWETIVSLDRLVHKVAFVTLSGRMW